MPLIDILSQAADAEQLRLHPLPVHAAAQQEEHLRRHYALVLVALLTDQPQVSETQSRLLLLLLDALQLGDVRATLFEEARALEPETLLEAARLIRDAAFAEHLLVDAMVLLRLDTPLTEDTARLVGELSAFLGIDAVQLQIRADDVAEILGLGKNTTSPLSELWPQCLPRPLTVEALRNGLQGGLWRLNSDLALNFSWKANDATLVFSPGVTINTQATNGTIGLTNCRLYCARLSFAGVKVNLQGCNWDGDYAEASIALKSHGAAVKIDRCNFATRNATAIVEVGGELNVSNSRFIGCGNRNVVGGAINCSDAHVFAACRFEACVGRYAGAVYVNNLTNLHNSEFIECRSTGLKGVTDLAIFVVSQTKNNHAVSGCVFRECSMTIGDANWSTGNTFVTDSQFQNSNLYFHTKDPKNFTHSRCIFDGGQAIEKAF